MSQDNVIIPGELLGAEMPGIIDYSASQENVSRWDRAKNWLGRKTAQAVIAAELFPGTNEAPRFSAFVAAEAAFPNNPLIGPLVLGGSTFLIEGAGAVATARVLTDETDHKVVNWLNHKIDDATVGRDISPAAERFAKISVAYNIGTPALLALEQAQNPQTERTEAKRRGLVASAWLAGVLAVEGALISQSVDLADTTPGKLGVGIAGAALIAAGPHTYNKLSSLFKEKVQDEHEYGSVIGVINGGELSKNAGDRLAKRYESFRQNHDEAVKIGLYGHDLCAAFEDTSTMLLAYQKENGVKSYMPFLVPAENLEWYNMNLLKRSYGEKSQFYYYAHPPIAEGDVGAEEVITESIREIIENGGVIFTDEYETQPLVRLHVIAQELGLRWEDMGDDGKERNGQVFATEGRFGDSSVIKKASNICEVYSQCVADGEIIDDRLNGVSVTDVITGNEAEKIWDLYKKPFDDLTVDHPMSAGFDKDDLLEILADPRIAKIVNRVDGDITTLLFFQQNFNLSPWFNKKYYQDQFTDYYETENIFIFPGIVTDENKRGMGYAQDVIDLATTLMSKRGSDVLVTFECTETSATYIPEIVSSAIGNNGLAHITPMEKPISKTNYKVLRRA